jgi:hypothetical protein
MPSVLEGLGTEAVVDEIFLVLRERLNDAIAYQQARWDAHDQARATRLGVGWEQLLIEPVEPDNFHSGVLPSFIMEDDRVEAYPLVAVTPGTTIPDAENVTFDQIDVYNNAVVVHAFGRGNPTEGAEVAYRRSMRMAEAVHQIIHTDRSLKKIIKGVSAPQLVNRSEPWKFPAGDGHGEDWVWMAVAHQYQVKNYSQPPQEV